MKGKNELSYPHKDKKTKKIIRKEIPIARIDTSNKDFMEKLKQNNIAFSTATLIFIVVDGELQKWDANY